MPANLVWRRFPSFTQFLHRDALRGIETYVISRSTCRQSARSSCALVVRARSLPLVNGVQGPRRGGQSSRRETVWNTAEEFRAASYHGAFAGRRGAKYPPADVRSAEKLFLFRRWQKGTGGTRVTHGGPARPRNAANRCFIRATVREQEGSRRIDCPRSRSDRRRDASIFRGRPRGRAYIRADCVGDNSRVSSGRFIGIESFAFRHGERRARAIARVIASTK